MLPQTKRFNVRLGRLELRSCGKYLQQDAPHDRAEIVAFNPDGTSYAVAFWSCNSSRDEWSLQFVGRRPLQRGMGEIWQLIQLGQDLVEAFFAQE